MKKNISIRIAGLLLCATLIDFAPDEDFMSKADQANLAEIAAAQLALSKSSSAFVKKFANQMLQDHQTAEEELTTLAAKKGVKLPGEPDAEHKATKEQLAALSGAAFDSGYMDAQIKDHKSAVALFTSESENGTDPDAKAYAGKYLPKLKHHLMMTGEGKTASMKMK